MQLKSDLFGTIARHATEVHRDVRASRTWLRWLARHLARREARALRVLDGTPGVPALVHFDRDRVVRTWIEGRPMHEAQPGDPSYFRAAARLVRRLHRRGVAHNDLAKETNWLVTPQLAPALVDFQLAFVSRRRSALFRSSL